MNWKRASNQNFPAARLRVGDHHWYGLGVERNYAQAALYYRMCSEDNDPHASAQVGDRTTLIRCSNRCVFPRRKQRVIMIKYFRPCLIWGTCIILEWDFPKIIISRNVFMMLQQRNLLKVCNINWLT